MHHPGPASRLTFNPPRRATMGHLQDTITVSNNHAERQNYTARRTHTAGQNSGAGQDQTAQLVSILYGPFPPSLLTPAKSTNHRAGYTGISPRNEVALWAPPNLIVDTQQGPLYGDGGQVFSPTSAAESGNSLQEDLFGFGLASVSRNKMAQRKLLTLALSSVQDQSNPVAAITYIRGCATFYHGKSRATTTRR